MTKPVCLITGVGPEGGTGAEAAKRLSEGGYQVAMLARNAQNLDGLAGKYEGARAFPCDMSDLDAIVETVAPINSEIGAPKVVVHNALRSTRGGILETDPENLEMNFRVNTTALLYLARDAQSRRGRDPGDRQYLGHPRQQELRLLRLDQGSATDVGGIHGPGIRAARDTRRLLHHRRRD